MAQSRDRLIGRLAAVLASLHTVESGAARLCEAGRRMLDADGAALTIVSANRSRLVVATTDDLASELEDLQEVVGEGPSRDAFERNSLQVADFSTPEAGRWSLMHEHGQRLGFSGRVVAVPLRPDELPVGVLSAHRADTGFRVDPLTAEVLGVAIGTALLQDSRLGVQGDVFAEVWPDRARIHQATGMIISQVGVRPEDALALLRGHAFASNSTLLDVAQQVVERHINFRHFTIEGD